MVYILNGISVSMFQDFPVSVEIARISPEQAMEIVSKEGKDNVVAVINRKDVAQDVSNLLGIEISLSSKKVFFSTKDDVIIVRHRKLKRDGTKNVIYPESVDIEFYLMYRY